MSYFDTSDVIRFSHDLGAASGRVVANARRALEVTARHMKEDAAENAKGRSGGHAKRYPSSIDYDMFGLRAEIGPNLGRAQGGLGILEDAPGGVRAAPQGALRRAAEANLDDFERGMARAAEDLF
jgi:hypothetical protein